jgi:hypothetical protein
MPTPLWILAAIALALVAAALVLSYRTPTQPAHRARPTPPADDTLQSFADAAGEW